MTRFEELERQRAEVLDKIACLQRMADADISEGGKEAYRASIVELKLKLHMIDFALKCSEGKGAEPISEGQIYALQKVVNLRKADSLAFAIEGELNRRHAVKMASMTPLERRKYQINMKFSRFVSRWIKR
jgi:hypothetical protein